MNIDFVDKTTVVPTEWLQFVNDFCNSGGVAGGTSILNYIPESEWPAIQAGTSAYDAIDDINLALEENVTVYLPPGHYFITRPINMTARRVLYTYWGRRLIGAGAQVTVINAYTGNYPCIDCTGMNLGRVEGINFRSDNPAAPLIPSQCASIGLYMGRGEISTGSNQMVLVDLRFNLTSDMTRNAGTGTVGIINHACEHLIRDRIQIYANLPIVDHVTLQFGPSYSADLPVYGGEYEQHYTGPMISCTVARNTNMQLISWDSFRAIWMFQVGQSSWPTLYTSTRMLVTSIPSYSESFLLEGSSTNIDIDCIQETSGKFGAIYCMDHAYFTLHGPHSNLKARVQRVVYDVGFVYAAIQHPSIRMLSAGILSSDINCNYLFNSYNDSGDNCGFAAVSVQAFGPISWLINTKFILDSAAHNNNFDPPISAVATNVRLENYWMGTFVTIPAASVGIEEVIADWTPNLRGSTSAGVATYSTLTGRSVKHGKLVHITCEIGWTAHTGTGTMRIEGLPYNPRLGNQTMAVYYTLGVGVGAGLQLAANIASGIPSINLKTLDPATGVASDWPVDASGGLIVISGTYEIP